MIVRTIEILLEYIAIIVCIHKVGKKKINFSASLVNIFLINLAIIFLIDMGKVSSSCKVLVLGCLLMYVRIKVINSWKKSIGLYVVVLLSVMALQYTIYLLFSIVQLPIQSMKLRGVIINFVVFLVLLLWKENYLKIMYSKVKEWSREGIVLILIIICLRLLYLSNKDGVIQIETLLQFYVEILGLCLALILWFSSEIENRHKAKEIQMYELYNKAFEETISTIRMRQHEFRNHINAIRCMQYTIENRNELLATQEQYCANVLKESEISNLLKLQMEPTLIGFLYAKITTAEEVGISTEYEIDAIDIKGQIKIYEIIELIGILYDNAIETLINQEDKRIMLKLKNIENGFVIEVANRSRVYIHSEIEKFCTYGYSTKSTERGLGLTRVKELTKKMNAELLIQNKEYNTENYLCFKVRFCTDKTLFNCKNNDNKLQMQKMLRQ